MEKLGKSRRLKIVDVGARGGLPKRWRPFFDQIEVIGFEPDPQECERLNALSHPYAAKYLPYALGDEDESEKTLHICRHGGSSSLLEPHSEFCDRFAFGSQMKVVRTCPVVVSRLDSVCPDLEPHLIKIDTQGTELHVLRGAGTVLNSVIAIDLEVEFVPQYLAQPLFADVDQYLRSLGFMLRALRRSLWREKDARLRPEGGQIVHGDALYIRRDRIDCDPGHLILAAYRQYDLLETLGAKQLIPPRSMVAKVLSTGFGWIPNRYFRYLADVTRKGDATDWHDIDLF
jgi:FkbM family methyltransferase